MASGDRADLPPRQWKILAMTSGNRCAFPGCGKFLAIPGEDGQGDLVLGVAAHIVGASRQGPRGDFDISDDERDTSARNRILVCPEHHVVIDSRPTVYTVQVLRKMKEEHERQFLPPKEQRLLPEPVTESLLASLMSISGLPSFIMSAPLIHPTMGEGQVAGSIAWPQDRRVVLPYIVRDKRLYTFADLSSAHHPFTAVVTESPQVISATELWSDAEGHRRYVALLNKALTKHLGRFGIRYDRDHHRYWFTAEPGPSPRAVRYHTKQGRNQQRDVVRQRIRRSTGEAKEWWHVAAGLRFEQVASAQWVLAVRPEYQITLDGVTPLPPKAHGSRSTRKKSKLYNEGYLDLLHFWREFLVGDQPRLVIRVGDQRIVIDGNLLDVEILWPGVPGDVRAYRPRESQDDLFTAFEHAEASEQLEIDDWTHDEGDSEL
jgi:hypothetical protein